MIRDPFDIRWSDATMKPGELLRLTREAGRKLSDAIGAARRGDCYGANALLNEARLRSQVVEQWVQTFRRVRGDWAPGVLSAQYRLGTAARRTRKRVARLCGW